MNKCLERGLILSLDYFYDNINSYILNKLLLNINSSFNNNVSAIKTSYSNLILELKYSVDLPVIGCVNKVYPDTIVNLTPTVNEIYELAKAGASIIYLDASTKMRSNFITIHEFYYKIKSLFPELYFIGEVYTLEDIKNISCLKFDAICIRNDSYTISNFVDYIDIDVPLIFDSIVDNNLLNDDKYNELFNAGFNNIIVNSKIITPKYQLKEFIENVFN
ncbi:N-acetylmannosamine-6-phosphate epimerase [Candidatus Arthromitus sp. SFB-mouse-Japan]|uniref:N-acetylmannosamine-6-phosphate 2-epimerase n=2 Tax=Candidatus Arthromitus sp. SFB-mouse TaxID=49118 RepID=UPI00021B7D55|nr:N-acetylmannosamine-6-phosphate 2-epimerase [Candidatus Arthromitus sp. SFB-mouse]EIA30319.1 Putative N-acetylmannosamine-6-phosphate 2-epimerase [Candidatus Arthromitus sp. SFB-mouse-SU]BAK56052.1 N-acetylmannosamine-6-phosphate epimerase [Candidatus Arthromitus sp. SFB-mouse-Japan]BAK79391.1 N-acylglucosamine-6-phosphate 2-epimerase [Candidatus Arthromitus sp. SFB-mouse-Yit]